MVENLKDKFYSEVMAVLIMLIFMIYISYQNYLLFHSIIEFISIIIAVNIFIVAINTVHISNNNYLLFIGIAYGFVGVFDFLHTLAYKGMGVFPTSSSNLPTQLWVISRYIESSSLLISPIFLNKNLKKNKVFLIYVVISAILLSSFFYFKVFPDCFIEGVGITLFKKVSEYLIIGLLGLTIVSLRFYKTEFNPKIYKFILLGLGLTILSEISFIFFINPYDALNMLGHLFKLMSFYFIYKAITETSLKEPQELVYYKLNQKKQQLQQERDKLLDIAEVIFLILNQQGEIELINDKGCEILGYPAEEVIGNNWFDKFIKKEDRLEIKKRFESMIAQNIDPIRCTEYEVLTNSGEERTILWNRTIIKDQEGKIDEILSSGIDITERERLEEKVEYHQLRTKFFTNLSHELKTPLNLISSGVQMLNFKVENNRDQDKYRRYIKIIEQNNKRQVKLVNNLVDIAKIDFNSYNLNLQNHDIVELVERIVGSIKDYVEEEKKKLYFNSEVEEEIIACDPFNIERVMLNLISNAIKFTDEGDKISLHIYKGEKKIYISVKDTGVGIPEEKQELIFQRFGQVDESLTRNQEGSGIGLSLVSEIVELHDGKIIVESEYGLGSEFIIELPIKTVDDESSVQQKSQAISASNIADRLKIEFADIYC